jgi:hypothetical protein
MYHLLPCSGPTYHTADRTATATLCFPVVHRRKKPFFSKMSQMVNCLKQFLNYASSKVPLIFRRGVVKKAHVGVVCAPFRARL